MTDDDIWIYTEGEDEGGNNRCYSDAPTEIIANDLDDKDPLVTVDVDWREESRVTLFESNRLIQLY